MTSSVVPDLLIAKNHCIIQNQRYIHTSSSYGNFQLSFRSLTTLIGGQTDLPQDQLRFDSLNDLFLLLAVQNLI
jgi:hypothetical protein